MGAIGLKTWSTVETCCGETFSLKIFWLGSVCTLRSQIDFGLLALLIIDPWERDGFLFISDKDLTFTLVL